MLPRSLSCAQARKLLQVTVGSRETPNVLNVSVFPPPAARIAIRPGGDANFQVGRIRWVTEHRRHPATIDADEIPPLDPALSRPRDRASRVGNPPVDRLGIAVSDHPCDQAIARIEQPRLTGFGPTGQR